MKLGDVLKKERERRQLDVEKTAALLGISIDEYKEFEAGASAVEEWGPKLAQLAIKLSAPASRLISETGKSDHARHVDGQCGKLIKAYRERRQLSPEELAKQLELPAAEIVAIENGQSPLETYAPLLLKFAEVINQPIFNLFYPCGLPLDKLQDYP